MASPLFADISSYQTVSSWQQYANWSQSGDGMSRVVLKASEGVGFKDKSFESFWSGSIAANVQQHICYHYARPDLNPGTAGAANEAQWFASVIGHRLAAQDLLMLDFEQNEDAAWARTFYAALMQALPRPVHPVLYDSVSHFQQFFASDMWLAQMYDCALAAWHPISQGPPAAPPGWRMLWWQYADNEQVPGIGVCDSNLWLGGGTMVPTGPFYKVTAGQNGVPAVPNAIAAAMGLSWPDILAIPGQNPALAGYDPTLPGLAGPGSFGQWLLLPGFPPPAVAASAKLVIDETSIRAVLA